MLEQSLPGHLLSEMRQTVRPLVQIRLVDLENISGKDHLGAFSGTGDYGLDLMRRQILGLVDYEERLSETSTPDIGKRSDQVPVPSFQQGSPED